MRLLRSILLPGIMLLLACSERVSLQPLPEDAVLLAFGDSLTYGTGADAEESYPAQLQERIGFRVIRSGVPGEITQRGLQRLPSVLDEYEPDLVLLWHGANDILRRMDRNQASEHLAQMIMLIRESGAEVVLLAAPEFGITLSDAPFYEDLASQEKVPLIGSPLGGILYDNRLKSDQVHPNADGYAIIAERVEDALKTFGATK